MTRLKPSVGKRGFTLIELMIVVAIIGILAAVAIPKFAEMIRKSKEGATKGSLSALRSALTIYMSDNEGEAPLENSVTFDNPQLIVAMVSKYIEIIPTVKLGEYHSDTATVLVSVVTGSFGKTQRGDYSDDSVGGGWVYVTAGGASFWANCSHTHTKNTGITGW